MRALGGALFAGVGRVRQASLETEIAAMETMSTGVRAQQPCAPPADPQQPPTITAGCRSAVVALHRQLPTPAHSQPNNFGGSFSYMIAKKHRKLYMCLGPYFFGQTLAQVPPTVTIVAAWAPKKYKKWSPK